MKKVCKIVGVVMGCVLAFGQVQAQIPFGQKMDGEVITFYPVMVKSEELVAVDLVTSTRYRSRYIALEQSVMQNDWRPILSMDGNLSNPGKCIIIVLKDGYGVDCRLVDERKGAFARYVIVQTINQAIAFVHDFSKNRTKK